MPDKKEKPRRPDETIPGGAYIEGGHMGEDEKHYGGRVVNADGEVLAEFADDQENTGRPRPKAEPPKPATTPTPPAGGK